jgi:hypothetical protein
MPAMPRPPFGVRVKMALRRLRFGLAVRLVRGMDGLVVSKVATQAAAMEIAKLQSTLGDVLGRRGRLGDALQRRVGGIAQLMAVAAEAGDPQLQAQELVMLYAQVRQATMSRRERARAQATAAQQQLMQRHEDPRLFRPRPTGKTKALPAQPGKVPQAVLDAMAKETTA